jgi:hypothetical protein
MFTNVGKKINRYAFQSSPYTSNEGVEFQAEIVFLHTLGLRGLKQTQKAKHVFIALCIYPFILFQAHITNNCDI